jgi:flagellar hook-length control protein FliK
MRPGKPLLILSIPSSAPIWPAACIVWVGYLQPKAIDLVTSHLSVSITAAQAAAPVATGLSNVGKAASGQGDGFAALLDVVKAAANLAGGNVGAALAKLGQAATAATGETNLAIPLQATTAADPAVTDPATTDTKSQLMAGLIASLSELDKAVKSGQPVDQDLLKRVKQSVDALANFLAAQQPAVQTPATPAPADPTVAASGAAGAVPSVAPTGSTTTDAAAAAQTALTGFAAKLTDIAAGLGKTEPDLAAKLTDLAKALDPVKLSAETMTQLGIGTTPATSDPKVASAINGFVNGQATADPAQPVLAAPRLKLSGDTSFAAGGSNKTDVAPATPHAATPVTAVAIKPLASTAGADNNANPAKADHADKTAAAASVAAAQVTANATADASAPAGAGASANAQVAATASVTGPSAPQPADALRLGAAAYQAAAPAAVNLPQLAFDIARHIQQGSSHFQVRLDPADLGRVDVKLAIDSTGTVNAHLTVERPETLDLLKRDSSALSQALNQPGTDGSKTNLQFSLSQNPFTRQDNGSGSGTGFAAASGLDDDGGIDAAGAVATALYRGVATASGVNIFV